MRDKAVAIGGDSMKPRFGTVQETVNKKKRKENGYSVAGFFVLFNAVR